MILIGPAVSVVSQTNVSGVNQIITAAISTTQSLVEGDLLSELPSALTDIINTYSSSAGSITSAVLQVNGAAPTGDVIQAGEVVTVLVSDGAGTEPRSFLVGTAAVAPQIVSSLAFDPFMVVEGSTRAAMVSGSVIPDYDDPTTYLTIPADFSITTSEVLYSTNENSIGWGLTEELDTNDNPSITVNVTAEKNGIERTFTATASGYVRQFDPVARNQGIVRNLIQGQAPDPVLYTDLFGPSSPSTDWTANLLDIGVTSIPGVTFGSNAVVLDPSVLALQSNTVVTVTADYNASFPPLSYDSPQVSDTFTFSVAANVVEIVQGPVLTNGAIFAGTEVTANQFNIDTLLDPANYTGVTDPFIIVRHQPSFVGLYPSTGRNPYDTVPPKPGENIRILIDVYDTEGGSILQTFPYDYTVQAAYSVAQIEFTNFVLWRPTVIDEPAGPPDAYPVVDMVIDGRNPRAGLTVGILRDAATQLVYTHEPTDTLPPAIAGPPGVAVTVTSEAVGAGVRWTASASGYADVVVDFGDTSPTYTLREYDLNSNSHFAISYADTATLQLAMWIDPALLAEGMLAAAPSGRFDWTLEADGSMRIFFKDSSGTRIFDATTPANAVTTGRQHLVVSVDLAGPSAQIFVNGAAVTLTPTIALTAGTGLLDGSTFSVFAASNGSDKLNAVVGDVVLQLSSLTPVATLYNSGTPQAVPDSGAYHLGADLTAAQLNAGQNNGSETVIVVSGNLTDV